MTAVVLLLFGAGGAAARPLATTDLAVTQTASATAAVVGQTLTVTIAVSNGGPDTANSVVVRDALTGAKGTFASANPTKGQACTFGATNRTLRCVVGTLANGETAQVTAVVSLAGPGTLTAAADVSGRETDPNQANQIAQLTADVTETTPPADLKLSGTAFAAPFTPRPQFTVSWRATDVGGSGIGGYDVRYRTASSGSAFGRAVAWQTNTAETRASFTGRRGSTYCFSFRARDKDGNVSPWTSEQCAAILLGAGDARRAGAWKTSSSGSARSNERGATLTLPVVAARAVYVEAVRCPGCGSVAVLWQGRIVRTLRLDASSSGRALVRILDFPTLRHGSLSLRVATARATVTVAAFGIAKR